MISEKKQRVPVFALYLLLIAIICAILSLKADYHVDELFTYELSNSDHHFNPENGVRYTPASAPFIEVFSSNGTFDLTHVWKQQVNDTHPPIYYILVHAICSLFPGQVSMSFAGIINVAFLLLTFTFYRKMIRVLIDDNVIVYSLSLAFCLSAGILNISAFLRMYVMAMFFVTAFTCLVIKNIKAYSCHDFAILAIVAFCGTLTQEF